MTALTNRSNNAVKIPEGADPFGAGTEKYAQTTYMKFKGASGQFLAGSEEDEIEHGSEFAAGVFDAEWIWTFWWEGKVIETVPAFIREDPMSFENMPDFLPAHEDIDMTLEDIIQAAKDDPANFRDGWSVQASFNLRPLDGTDEEFTLRLGGSVSLRAFHALRRSYGRQYKLKAGLLPIVTLSADQYKSKIPGVGKRYAPVIKITGWASEEELMGAMGEDEGDYGDMDDAPDTPQIEDKSVTEDKTVDDAEVVDEKPAARRGARGARGRNFGNKE